MFLLLSLLASDLLGIVADDQAPLWERLGSELRRDGGFTDHSRIQRSQQVSSSELHTSWCFFTSSRSFLQPHPLCVGSVTMRPAAAAGGDDGLGKQDQGASVRLQGATEPGPLDASTPQVEEPPSSLGSQQDDSKNQRRSPLPKHSLLSLDLNANENSGTEQSGSESLEDGKMSTGDV